MASATTPSTSSGTKRVHREGHQGVATGDLPTDLHRGDVDPVLAEDRADLPDDPGAVLVHEEEHVRRGLDLDLEVPDLDHAFGVLLAQQRAADLDLGSDSVWARKEIWLT